MHWVRRDPVLNPELGNERYSLGTERSAVPA
jgi:hypothetical protein